MTYHAKGGGLYFDMMRLLVLANEVIPGKAKVFAAASTEVAGTADDERHAFASSGGASVPAGGESPASSGPSGSGFYAAWTTLRDTLQDVLAETADNMNDTATTLVGFVNDAVDKDHGAAAKIRAEGEGLRAHSEPGKSMRDLLGAKDSHHGFSASGQPDPTFVGEDSHE